MISNCSLLNEIERVVRMDLGMQSNLSAIEVQLQPLFNFSQITAEYVDLSMYTIYIRI